MDAANVLSSLKIDLRGVTHGSFDELTDEENRQCTAKAIELMLSKVVSKLRPQAGQHPHAVEAAIAKFRDVNFRVRHFDVGQRRTFEWEEELYGTFKQKVRKFFYPHEEEPLILGLEQILANGALGPGSNLGADGTDFYTKLFSSDLGVTSDSLYDTYRRWSLRSPTWAEAEDTRLSLGYGTATYKASKMTTVPKNDAISRVIGVEPSLNMFFQLGLGAILNRRLKQMFGIDIRTQSDINRELAREGSVFDDNVTIDLESASDSISLSLFRDIVPRDQRCFFELLRTTAAIYPDGSCEELGMLSMMGNGFTFPFQTMVFSCMVSASFEYLGLPSHNAREGNWGVFGDDIICPQRVSRCVLSLLNMCGFTVNDSKTFVEGPFRESCGGDFYLGHNIRPVYIKDLATQEARYTVINRLVDWSAQTGIHLPVTIRLLLSSVKWRPVPWVAGYDAGVRVPLNLTSGLKLSRNGSYIVEVREPVVRKLQVGESSVAAPRGEKRRKYNAAGLLITAMQGGWRKGGIGIRSNTPLYRSRQRVCPTWYAPSIFPSGIDGWRRWIDAATSVLKPR